MKKLKFIKMDDGKLQKINPVIGVIISLVFTVGFGLLVAPNLSKKIIKIEEMYFLDSSRFSKIVNLTKKQNYIFKLKYDFTNTNTEEVMLNGRNLELKRSKESKVIRTRYYYAPKEIMKEGRNFLKINFYPINPLDIDLRIRNYEAWFAGGNIVVTLNDFVRERTDFVLIMKIGFFVFSFGLWIVYVYLGKLLGFTTKQVLFNNIVLFLSWAGFYFILGVSSFFSPYYLVVSPAYLFGILFIGTLIPNICFILFHAYFLIKLGNSSVAKSKLKSYEISREQSKLLSKLISYKIPERADKLFYWLKSRKLSDKCVLLFMVLLVFSAVLLILSMEWVAYKTANIAYLVLVFGVVIKLVKMLREVGKNKNV